MKIRMSSPDLTEADRQAVEAVVNTPNLSMGPNIDAFEKAFCELTGAKHAIGVNSGTAGLHLCIRAAGINPGDIVITTPFSFVASTNVILFEKAIPVFIDVDPVTGNINTDQLARAVEDLSFGGERADRWMPRKLPEINRGGDKQLKAVLPVDVFGQPADYEPIKALAGQYGLKVIEDSCEALGGEYKGRYAGTLGDYGVFAFYPNKQITTGEGGLIITDDDEAAQTKSKAPTKNVKDSKKTSDEDEEQYDEDEVPSDEDDSDSSEEKGNSSKRHRSGYSRSYTRAVKEAEDKEKASLKRRRIDSSSSDDDLPLMHLKKSKPLRK